MKDLARKFQGSIIAFCTLKNSFKRKEQRLLRNFAEKGRRPIKNLVWPTPVLILTGNELCVMEPGSFHHNIHRDNAIGLARRIPRGDFNMLNLCGASQQEYLGLPSYYNWLDEYYTRKSKRRRRS